MADGCHPADLPDAKAIAPAQGSSGRVELLWTLILDRRIPALPLLYPQSAFLDNCRLQLLLIEVKLFQLSFLAPPPPPPQFSLLQDGITQRLNLPFFFPSDTHGSSWV